jgi:hypothetical protein
MSDIRNWAQNGKKMVNEYQQKRIDLALAAAQDINALAKNRMINKRVDAEGEDFGIYSPTYWKSKKTKLNNDQRINFQETKRMWSTTFPQVLAHDSETITVDIKPRDPNREKVMDYHEERFKRPLISLNKQELQLLDTIYEGKITQQIFQKYYG